MGRPHIVPRGHFQLFTIAGFMEIAKCAPIDPPSTIANNVSVFINIGSIIIKGLSNNLHKSNLPPIIAKGQRPDMAFLIIKSLSDCQINGCIFSELKLTTIKNRTV